MGEPELTTTIEEQPPATPAAEQPAGAAATPEAAKPPTEAEKAAEQARQDGMRPVAVRLYFLVTSDDPKGMVDLDAVAVGLYEKAMTHGGGDPASYVIQDLEGLSDGHGKVPLSDEAKAQIRNLFKVENAQQFAAKVRQDRDAIRDALFMANADGQKPSFSSFENSIHGSRAASGAAEFFRTCMEALGMGPDAHPEFTKATSLEDGFFNELATALNTDRTTGPYARLAGLEGDAKERFVKETKHLNPDHDGEVNPHAKPLLGAHTSEEIHAFFDGNDRSLTLGDNTYPSRIDFFKTMAREKGIYTARSPEAEAQMWAHIKEKAAQKPHMSGAEIAEIFRDYAYTHDGIEASSEPHRPTGDECQVSEFLTTRTYYAWGKDADGVPQILGVTDDPAVAVVADPKSAYGVAVFSADPAVGAMAQADAARTPAMDMVSQVAYGMQAQAQLDRQMAIAGLQGVGPNAPANLLQGMDGRQALQAVTGMPVDMAGGRNPYAIDPTAPAPGMTQVYS